LCQLLLPRRHLLLLYQPACDLHLLHLLQREQQHRPILAQALLAAAAAQSSQQSHYPTLLHPLLCEGALLHAAASSPVAIPADTTAAPDQSPPYHSPPGHWPAPLLLLPHPAPHPAADAAAAAVGLDSDQALICCSTNSDFSDLLHLPKAAC
jgi:hypothetical protein